MTDCDQFGVILNSQHLVEELERLVIVLGLLEPLFFIVELKATSGLALHSLSRYHSLLTLHLVYLFVRHKFRALFEQFYAAFVEDLEVIGRWERYRRSSIDDTIDSVRALPIVADARVLLDFVQFDLLNKRLKVIRPEVCIRLEECHRSDILLDRFDCLVVSLARLTGEALDQLDLLHIRQLIVEVVRRLDHLSLDQIEVHVLNPVIAALYEHLPSGPVGKYFLEDHALEGLLAMLFELGTELWQACRVLHLELVFCFLFLLVLAHHHIIIAEHGAQAGLLAHEP